MKDHAKDPVMVEFDALPVDADEETRQRLAERLRVLPYVQEMQSAFPGGAGIYNRAQIDVLIRMNI